MSVQHISTGQQSSSIVHRPSASWILRGRQSAYKSAEPIIQQRRQQRRTTSIPYLTSLPEIPGLGDFMHLRDGDRMDMTSDTMYPFTQAFTNSSYTMQQGVSSDPIGSVVHTCECPQGVSRNLSLSPEMDVANIISSLVLELWDLTENNLRLSQTILDKDLCIKRACAILESLCVPVFGCPRQARDSHSLINNSYGVGIIIRVRSKQS
jgi:hypothetical protein